MFKLVHKFENGQSVLCTDGKFHSVAIVGKVINGRKLAAKLYKNEGGAKRGAASWNVALPDYAAVEAA